MTSCWRNSSCSLTLCWIKSSRDVMELNVCRTRRCRTFGAWSIGTRRSLTTSTTLLNAFAYGLRGYVDIFSPSLLCISMDRSLRVRRIFLFSMQRFPTVASWARSMRRWYARVEHKELWAVIVIPLTTNILFWFGGIVGWRGPDQPYMSTHMRPVPPTDMQLVLHRGGWRVSVSPTLVESNLTAVGPWRRLKQQTWRNTIVVLCIGKNGSC